MNYVLVKPHWVSALKRKFGAGLVSTQPATLCAHGGDAWWAARPADAVFFPRRAADVAELLRWADAHKIPVTARGAGRGYVGGCVPVRGGIVVSFARMNRILEVSLADGVAVVQPGVITGDLQRAAARRGLFYPPDPASLNECFIGGNVATNAGGPRCVKYGVTRHYILGLEVALAEGSLVRVGSRTHKNKSGLDLVGLFVGSEGLLGLVTEITTRLIPLPPAQALLSAGFTSIEAAARACQRILAGGILPSTLEIADQFTLEAARRHLGRRAVPAGNAYLMVEVDGQKNAIATEARAVERIIRSSGALAVSIAKSEREQKLVWDLRRGFSMSLKATGLTKFNEDVTVPRGRVADLVRLGERLQKKYRFAVACFGHAGDGNIHVNLMVDLSIPGMKKKVHAALDELFTQVLKWGGVITGEHGIGLAKLPWWNQAASTQLRELHRRIKRAVDPNGILNPGKFI
jgi:glycolate oxidase